MTQTSLSRLLRGCGLFRTSMFFPLIFAANLVALTTTESVGFDKILTLGTSGATGTYAPVGQTLCKLVNSGRVEHGIRCIPYNTGGSVYNIQALQSGELDIAITQSDLAFQAFHGKGMFAKVGPNKTLKAIANLYSQPVTVVVKADSGISSLEQVAGRRINVGNLGSGKRTISDTIFSLMNWSEGNFKSVSSLPTDPSAEAFCAGEVDILIEALGIPAPFYSRVIDKCGGKFLSLPEKLVLAMKNSRAFFQDDVIEAGLYKNNSDNVRTVKLMIVLITTDRVDPHSIGVLARSIFETPETFRAGHPVLQRSTPRDMLDKVGQIPFHDGAARYYRAAGLFSP